MAGRRGSRSRADRAAIEALARAHGHDVGPSHEGKPKAARSRRELAQRARIDEVEAPLSSRKMGIALGLSLAPRFMGHLAPLVAFEARGIPVPRHQGIHTKTGVLLKNRAEVEWQEHVAGAAQAAWGMHPAIEVPVAMVAWFARRCVAGTRPGDPWDARPDLDNLLKALGDSITGKQTSKQGFPIGHVLKDDNLIALHVARKIYWSRSLVHVAIYRYEDVDAALSRGTPFTPTIEA